MISMQLNLDDLNDTELAAHVRAKTGVIIKRSTPRSRLIEIIEKGVMPTQEEWAGTMETRRSLELIIEKNWDWVNSQLPCKGENRGKCTVYPCPEGRHVDCYTSNRGQIQVHSRLP